MNLSFGFAVTYQKNCVYQGFWAVGTINFHAATSSITATGSQRQLTKNPRSLQYSCILDTINALLDQVQKA